VAALCSKGYDYFALGHIHARQVVKESEPRIVFPGNLQGRHAKETGPKGCELITVSDGRIESEFVALDVVRWLQVLVDATGVPTVDALAKLFVDRMEHLVSDARDRLHAIRVTIRGESVLHRLEAEQPGSVAAAIQAAAQDMDGADIWIEQVRLDLRSPLDRIAAAARPDAIGEVVRLVDALAADEMQLKAWVVEQLSDLTTLPRDLADADPASLSTEEIRAALADAEASVLAQLSEIAPSGSAS
jgi:DNA repair exonuclease SbcCD nuclease subunit